MPSSLIEVLKYKYKLYSFISESANTAKEIVTVNQQYTIIRLESLEQILMGYQTEHR